MKTSPTLDRSIPVLCLVATLVHTTTVAPVDLTAQARVLTVDDLRLEVGVSAPALSPDGRSVVVVTSRPNYEDNRTDRTLVFIDIATGTQRNLTPGRRSVGQPRWSPSGGHLALVDVGKDDGPSQVYVLPMAGGEAWQVTHAKNGAQGMEWSGESLLYRTAEVTKEREGEERHNRSFDVGDNSYLTRQARTSVHLWRIPMLGGEAKPLTEGNESISDVVVASDGHSVALQVLPRAQTGAGIRTVIRTLDLASGEQRDLASGYAVNASAYSPDGRLLAFTRPRGPEPGFNPNGIVLQPVTGGVPIEATRQLDRAVGGIAWLPDGKSFLMTGPDLTQGAMWHQPLDGSPRRLDLGSTSPSAPVVSSGGTVAFIGRETHRPSEIGNPCDQGVGNRRRTSRRRLGLVLWRLYDRVADGPL